MMNATKTKTCQALTVQVIKSRAWAWFTSSDPGQPMSLPLVARARR